MSALPVWIPVRRPLASRRLGISAAAGLCATWWCFAASAQINPFGRWSESLTQQDMRVMRGAADKLRSRDAQVGGTETWQNPESGNSGSITLIDRFEMRNMPCRKLRYTFRFRKSTDRPIYDLNFCQVPSGEWKIL